MRTGGFPAILNVFVRFISPLRACAPIDLFSCYISRLEYQGNKDTPYGVSSMTLTCTQAVLGLSVVTALVVAVAVAVGIHVVKASFCICIRAQLEFAFAWRRWLYMHFLSVSTYCQHKSSYTDVKDQVECR